MFGSQLRIHEGQFPDKIWPKIDVKFCVQACLILHRYQVYDLEVKPYSIHKATMRTVQDCITITVYVSIPIYKRHCLFSKGY